jgi:hypothetical protein
MPGWRRPSPGASPVTVTVNAVVNFGDERLIIG